MRVLALAGALVLLAVPAAGATPKGLKLLARDGSRLGLLYLDRTRPFTQPLTAAPYRELAFSGDGRLISIGGTIVGRVKLPTQTLTWAPTGERAAYVTTEGAVVVWTPAGLRRIEPKGFGANRWFEPVGLAWSADGALAIGRGAWVWLWRSGVTRRVAGPAPEDPGTGGPALAVPFAWNGDRVLWW